ncbi:MAG: alanine--glyoxylate aminotransferase family protein [Candidatus Omnitrophica bacterium]|nr:alanine--glyoxylate aminotransferase family protein [Candidatus Omnitrophota bacterium]
MKRNLLLTPGPTHIPPQLCEALGRPIIHHRTPQFQDNIKKVVEGLKEVFQTKNDIYILTSSGTGGMEAAVVNLLSPGDKAIAVDGGKFGERWVELCQMYKANTVVYKVEWGKAPTAAGIKSLLEAQPDTKAVFITLAETSTGVTPDVKAIGEVVAQYKAVLVVDAVSGLAVEEIKTDEWHCDVVVSGSHKGLMLAPGLAFVSASPKAIEVIKNGKTPCYYFDLRECKKAMEKVDTPFTPAIGIMNALVDSLEMIKKDGLSNMFARYKHLARAVRAGCKAIGLELFPDPSCATNVLTAVKVPANIDGEKLTKIMRDTYGITFAGGQDHLKGKVIRIAHMGALDEYDVLTGLACLEKVLHQMGHQFELGTALAAAQKSLNAK